MAQSLLENMQERLYVALASGPMLNCRPHASRQRLDFTQVIQLAPVEPVRVLEALLSEVRTYTLTVAPTVPASRSAEPQSQDTKEPTMLLNKLHALLQDAKIYEQDTGVHALYVGYPVLQWQPTTGTVSRTDAPQWLTPLCFVPVRLLLQRTKPAAVTLACASEGVDRVIPNAACMAWVERQTGKRLLPDGGMEASADLPPWDEINHVVAQVCMALGIPAPVLGATQPLQSLPKREEEKSPDPRVLHAAVLGLFPVSNQGLLRDVEALLAGEVHEGVLQRFLQAQAPTEPTVAPALTHRDRANDRLIAQADPCQARAVHVARHAQGLVIHGPPGTGKSQTLTNLIGDHLARGERVLFVCDKRTALDVVHHRLTQAGLGSLCAVLHNAQADQRDLYRDVRDQLEALPDSKPPNVQAELARVDDMLRTWNTELRGIHDALSTTSPETLSFHETVGKWLALPVVAPPGLLEVLPTLTQTELWRVERDVRWVVERAQREHVVTNPWVGALNLSLAVYLQHPVAHWHQLLTKTVAAAQAADATLTAQPLPFDIDNDLAAQGLLQTQLYNDLLRAAQHLPAEQVAHWAHADAARLTRAHATLQALAEQRATLATAPPEPELTHLLHAQQPSVGERAQWIAILSAYLLSTQKWYGFLCFQRKRNARAVLQRFGQVLQPETAERVRMLLQATHARDILHAYRVEQGEDVTHKPDVAALLGCFDSQEALLHALLSLHSGSPVQRNALVAALQVPAYHADLLTALRTAEIRAQALAALEEQLSATGLFSKSWQHQQRRDLRAGQPLAPRLQTLVTHAETVEGLLRMEGALHDLPAELSHALRFLLATPLSVDDAWALLNKAVLTNELTRRLQQNPVLQHIEPDRMRITYQQYQQTVQTKQTLVRDTILSTWTERQRQRLLSTTGSRLNSVGAELKRRLLLRGERALRMRQVIMAGLEHEGGDALFDMRPVWMTSPETAAQIFPRRALFDVILFDEASQCRLEEALPLLTRAHRVVIAGDPQQLPPTRFFESAIAATEDNDLSEQGLFETQQANTEDLLSAALHLDMESCHLDVHYRSQHSELIAFSNQRFYESRLQPLPGHPQRRSPSSPVRVVRVNGVYDQRKNLREAAAVVDVVRTLLSQHQPPSIGIACLNVAQRDAIVDALETAALKDPTFAEQLATAYARKSAASFEGLFVKNLENVQGDERDHLIISTTYGPDLTGKFYRRFGPLAMPGGGRRLNVLITRARQQVHLLTSIPTDAYRVLPPLGPTQTPNGAWLLFAYLHYAEWLEAQYAQTPPHAQQRTPLFVENPTRTPSTLVTTLAHQLRTTGLPVEAYWGNEGFCVDLVLRNPIYPHDGTVGILCDGTRYDKANDPIEWDLFRTYMLESQGWTLERVYAPHVFRNPARILAPCQQAAQHRNPDSSKISSQPSHPHTP